MSMLSPLGTIRRTLSLPRMSTFEAAAGVTASDDPRALALYAWNARVSSALLAPLHICEVVIRNAASEAIEQVYGPRWPWQIGFEQSLPSPRTGYNPQRDLQNARSRVNTTGKVIPELKFVFWQRLFTSRHDQRLWNPYLRLVLPNLGRLRQWPNSVRESTMIWSKFELCVIGSLIMSRCSPEICGTICGG